MNKKRPLNCGLLFYLLSKPLTPRYRMAAENTIMAIPPTTSKKMPNRQIHSTKTDKTRVVTGTSKTGIPVNALVTLKRLDTV
ncbi:hypothetical protein [Lentibacillus juripiscarius]|uniref:Uncharacterized protein n=1 Tax=Lentibacillus juripiscarius TaxID=257446 RepID=A0ABW5V1V4_9BACI